MQLIRSPPRELWPFSFLPSAGFNLGRSEDSCTCFSATRRLHLWHAAAAAAAVVDVQALFDLIVTLSRNLCSDRPFVPEAPAPLNPTPAG